MHVRRCRSAAARIRAPAHKLRDKRLGLERVVVVQPTAYGFDNSCTLDAMKQLGASARGVACVPVDVSDTEMERLTAAGIRAQRYVMFAGRPLSRD